LQRKRGELTGAGSRLVREAVLVLDAAGTVVYQEIVPEVTHAPDYDAAANYYIYVGTVNQNPNDPYAIQVGNGPLYVQVTWSPSLGAGQTNPDPVAIPPQGNLQMYSADTTSYNVTWPNTGDPFTLPQNLTQVVPVVANNLNYTATSGVATYKFTLLKKSPSRTLGSGNGGGTVKVKNT